MSNLSEPIFFMSKMSLAICTSDLGHGTQQAPVNESHCCSWTLIASAQNEEAGKYIVYAVVNLIPWKILISGSLISARFYSIKLAHSSQGTWKMSDVQEGKMTNLSKETTGALVLIKAAKNYGRKADNCVLQTLSMVKAG